MKTASLALLLVPLSVLLVGCPKPPTGQVVSKISAAKNYETELPPGQLALRKITDPAEIPDFSPAFSNDLTDLKAAIGRSLDYLGKGSSKAFFPYGEISRDQAVRSLQAFRQLLGGGMNSQQLNAAVRERFDVYTSVGCDNEGTVLFTGYYTPIFDASPVKTDKFKYPIYKVPPDLVKGFDGKILGRKAAGGQTVPYPARAEIERTNMLAGLELYWLSDPFEVYIAQVQGSACLRLPDGKKVTVGYAGGNGADYNSVGKELVKDGKLPEGALSLQAMIDYFKAHPDDVKEYTFRNPRFTFFAPSDDASPHGSLNEPVTALCTIATDKSIFPRACLAFISTELPQFGPAGVQMVPDRRFALDQDTGGAIRAAGRCDVYMGIGVKAGQLAGRTYREGRLYYLFLKPAMLTPPGLPPMTNEPPKPPQQ